MKSNVETNTVSNNIMWTPLKISYNFFKSRKHKSQLYYFKCLLLVLTELQLIK